MSNRALNEVRRRGESPMNNRDFQRLFPTNPPSPQAPPPPFSERVPKPVSPFQDLKKPVPVKTPIPALPRIAARALKFGLRRVPLVLAATLAYEIYQKFKGALPIPAHPALANDTPQYKGYSISVTCGTHPAFHDGRYFVHYADQPPPAPACYTLQALGPPSGFQAYVEGGDAPSMTIGMSTWDYSIALDRYHMVTQWLRDNTSPVGPYVQTIPAGPASGAKPAVPPQYLNPREWNLPFDTPIPNPYPALDPESLPVAQPAPTALPVPFRFIPQIRPTGLPDSSTRGYEAPAPVGRVVLAPAPTLEATPEPGPLRHIPPEVEFERPGVGVRERKAKISTAARVALGIVNIVTESNDLIDAMWKAMDKKCQKLPKHRGLRIMRPQHKLEALYANFDCVDFEQFVNNLIENEAEDRAFGKIGKQLGKFSRKQGRPVGVQAGPGAPGKLPKGTPTGPSPWSNWTDHFMRIGI